MLKAIPTEYNGIVFRSRLEVRWAIFMDSLGVKYQYELEGYDLDSAWYLPDFWLPEQEVWLEVKGGCPTNQEERKVRLLCEYSGKPVVILWGGFPMLEGGQRPILYDSDMVAAGYPEVGHYIFYPPFGDKDYNQRWCECPECGIIGIRYEGQSARLPCSCHNGSTEKVRNWASERLIHAYKAGLNLHIHQ